MVNCYVLVLLATLSAAEPSSASQPKRQKSLKEILKRVLSFNKGDKPDQREPVRGSRSAVTLNAALVNTVEHSSPLDYAPEGWRGVARCLKDLRKLGSRREAVAICAEDQDASECVDAVQRWIRLSRVTSTKFDLIEIGYGQDGTGCMAEGPYRLLLPAPPTMHRILRFVTRCVEISEPANKPSLVDLVKACVALLYYHPAALEAWCQYIGITMEEKLELFARHNSPLWTEIAVALLLAHSQLVDSESFNPTVVTELQIFAPVSAADTHAAASVVPDTPPGLTDSQSWRDRMAAVAQTSGPQASSPDAPGLVPCLVGLVSYLSDLSGLLPPHAPPLSVSPETCASRVADWTRRTHKGPQKLL